METIRLKADFRGAVRAAAFVLALGVAGTVLAPPLAAQDFNRTAGFYAGLMSFGDFNPGAGRVNGSTAVPLSLENGWVLGIEGDSWFRFPYLGWRMHGAYTSRPFQTPTSERDINVFLADLSLLARFLPVTGGNPIQVFVAAGGGIVHYDLGRGERINFTNANAFYPGDNETRAAIVYGAGVDIATPFYLSNDRIGVRFEFMDHRVLESPFKPISGGSEYGSVSNRRISASLFAGFDFLW